MKGKIVVFTNEYPYGNQETFLGNEIGYLSKVYKEIIIVPLFYHQNKRELSFENVIVLDPVISARRCISSYFLTFISPGFWKFFLLALYDCSFHPSSLLKALKQALIIKSLKKYLRFKKELFNTDLWYFYWGTNAVNVLPFIEGYPKCIARFHRYDLYGRDLKRGGEWQPFQSKVAKILDQLICVSNNGVDYLKKKYLAEAHKVFISRLGVYDNGLSRFGQDDILRIVTCSNLYPIKRVDKLARSLSKIKDIKIEWTHIGDGLESEKRKINELITAFPSNINCKFIGRKSNEEVMNFYKSSSIDLFINTSESEGAPVSIMEALSFGIPVIATDVGGTAELLNERCGILLSANFEDKDLVKLIQDFSKNHFKDQNMRIEARKNWQLNASAEINYELFTKMIK